LDEDLPEPRIMFAEEAVPEPEPAPMTLIDLTLRACQAKAEFEACLEAIKAVPGFGPEHFSVLNQLGAIGAMTPPLPADAADHPRGKLQLILKLATYAQEGPETRDFSVKLGTYLKAVGYSQIYTAKDFIYEPVSNESACDLLIRGVLGSLEAGRSAHIHTDQFRRCALALNRVEVSEWASALQFAQMYFSDPANPAAVLKDLRTYARSYPAASGENIIGGMNRTLYHALLALGYVRRNDRRSENSHTERCRREIGIIMEDLAKGLTPGKPGPQVHTCEPS
jgi:hypothetical protein